MQLNIHVHDKRSEILLERILEIVLDNKQKIKHIMATQAELAQQLTDLGTQLDKVLGEIQAEVQKLEDAIAAAGATTPEVDAALAAVKAKIQTLDDLNADPAPTV